MFTFTPYYDPSPRSWNVVANIISSLYQFFHHQKRFIPGSLRSLLPTLTYPWWYTRLPLVRFSFGSVRRVHPDTVPRAKILT